MDRAERIELMAEAIRQLVAEGEGYVIFSDAGYPENFVQLTAEGIVEVSSRNYRSSSLPRLTPEQVEQLVALGFAREATPNHQGGADLSDAAQTAERCEQAFAILATSGDFDLEVESGV